MAPASTLTNHHDENNSIINGHKRKSLANVLCEDEKLKFISDFDGDETKSVSQDFVKSYNINHYNIKLNIEVDAELDDQGQPIKCSAVHTLERDMPRVDYSHLVDELRDRILADSLARPGIYSKCDLTRCKQDSWFVARFLLRFKLNLDEAYDMMSKALRFNNESLIQNLRPEDFPAEFYQIGGVFGYEQDRKGNKLLYIRAKIHRKVPEVQTILQAFLYKTIKQVDELANGRGIAVVIDCSGAGLVNADMETLAFFISTLRNYFPKGLSYILVHELPWILKPIWAIAKNWISEEQSQLIKFSNSHTIREYIKLENLPDFLGGTCKLDYHAAPGNCTNLYQTSKLWGIETSTIRKLIVRYSDFLPEGALARFDEQLAGVKGRDNDDNSSEYSDVNFQRWLENNSSEQDSDQENKP